MAKIIGYQMKFEMESISPMDGATYFTGAFCGLLSGAVLSDCKKYRYKLWRIWDHRKPKVLFVMLNPSKADAETNDNTIRRCIGFAKAWGYGGFYVGNLFAYRSTDPDALYFNRNHGEDIIGPENDKCIDEMASLCEKIVFAWGNDGGLMGRCIDLAAKFPAAYCLGQTKIGHPAHPLFLKKSTELLPFKAYKFDEK